MSIKLSEKLSRAMFNGRTLNNKFRRGWWKVADAVATDGCPDDLRKYPEDAKAFWYNGCLAILTCKVDGKKTVLMNQNQQDDAIVLELAKVLQDSQSATITVADLGKATRQGAKRDLDALLSI